MNDHPINLTVRFLLEIFAIGIFALWGWRQPGMYRYALVVIVPMVAMALWGIFRVPGDPGDATVAVSGPVRLLIEALLFGAAVFMLLRMGYKGYGITFLSVLLLHYLVSYDRIGRLLQL